jgi:hypothetical protein
VGLAVLACACVVATAAAAPASGGRHLPYFSLMNERVAVKKLPLELRISLGDFPGGRAAPFGPPIHGPVWFGEVERPKETVMAAGNKRWVCESEIPDNEFEGGGGGCTTLASSRNLFNLHISSCGKGPARHYRIAGLVPNGVTGLEIEKADGTIGRTVPVVENTIAFTVGLEDFTLRGVGDAAAESLERNLPLAHALGRGENRAGCVGLIFAEARGE